MWVDGDGFWPPQWYWRCLQPFLSGINTMDSGLEYRRPMRPSAGCRVSGDCTMAQCFMSIRRRPPPYGTRPRSGAWMSSVEKPYLKWSTTIRDRFASSREIPAWWLSAQPRCTWPPVNRSMLSAAYSPRRRVRSIRSRALHGYIGWFYERTKCAANDRCNDSAYSRASTSSRSVCMACIAESIGMWFRVELPLTMTANAIQPSSRLRR